MSISIETMDLIYEVQRLVNKDWKSFKLCELGNQGYFDSTNKTKKVFKYLYQSWGGNHTSIDLNGQDNALKLDLTISIDQWNIPSLKNSFDVVTNFGTTEHCFNQFQTYKNIHELVKKNGYIVHAVPLNGYWKNHSPYKYTKEFFVELAQINEYKVNHYSERKRGKNFLSCCILQKTTNKEFVWKKDIRGLYHYQLFSLEGNNHYL